MFTDTQRTERCWAFVTPIFTHIRNSKPSLVLQHPPVDTINQCHGVWLDTVQVLHLGLMNIKAMDIE